ncbi:uncharacterized protein LOC130727603 isoform X2 [Lotus japonicus]|uniref:uncharacterized protein LOC130727603 isoform X2 n=1 Tax=Lotus japonicus TaxID=34305 RepID=UPI0025844930|nr:uncharacterized protein LOC130727603 isoform X2 [Lotus japonicus]
MSNPDTTKNDTWFMFSISVCAAHKIEGRRRRAYQFNFKFSTFPHSCPSPRKCKLPMFPSILNSKQPQEQQRKQKGEWLAGSFKPENFIPGLIIGFIFGMFLDLSKPHRNLLSKKIFSPSKVQQHLTLSGNGDREFKMVLVVRQDLKMKSGKIASQCAHAATGMYAELMQSDRSLLRQWEQCGQPKIVVTCRNQQEMNKLKETAESIGLPTFVVADAGRTEVSAGSKTVLAVGPGPKASVDSVTGRLALL